MAGQVSIFSEKRPQGGQKHRSSDNFSTEDLIGKRIKWSCPDGVGFHVWQDVPRGTDRKMFYDQRIMNGTITEMVRISNLYISNPDGATSAFSVMAEAVDTNSITSEPHPLSGQDNRSSSNFKLNCAEDYARVIFDPGISFKIKQDIAGGTDRDVVYDSLKHGPNVNICIREFKNKKIYISNPQGATDPFTIRFEPMRIDNVDTSDWMGKLLNQNRKLSQLNIPGSHDSGTKYLTSIVSATGGRCQNADITGQLLKGIRFLDIRINNGKNLSDYLLDITLNTGAAVSTRVTAMGKNEPLMISHGAYSCGITFGQVLEDCRDFLTAHPGEVILMSVKNDGENNVVSFAFEQYLKCYKDLFYFTDTIPTVAEARGKIVLFYRFDFKPSEEFKNEHDKTGINLSIRNNDYTYYKNEQGVYFYVEDRYEAHDTHKKKEYIEDTLNRAILTGDNSPSPLLRTDGKTLLAPSWNDDITYITFCNIGTIVTHTPYDYAWGLPELGGIDPAINRWLKQYLINDYRHRRLGIILMDFFDHQGYDTELCHLIIGQNR